MWIINGFEIWLVSCLVGSERRKIGVMMSSVLSVIIVLGVSLNVCSWLNFRSVSIVLCN